MNLSTLNRRLVILEKKIDVQEKRSFFRRGHDSPLPDGYRKGIDHLVTFSRAKDVEE
jgi:hypothetical protein